MAQASNKIGLFTAIIICMNAIIGSGIFTTPTALASCVGPAGVLAYVIVIIAIWFMAVSFARLAELYPKPGSFYTYTKPWAGKTGGIISVTFYLIGLIIAMGLLTRVAGEYLHPLYPSLSAFNFSFIVLGLLLALNLFGVALSQLGQQILIVTTTFPLFATTILCLLHADYKNLIPFAPYGYKNVLSASKLVIFGFFGFESAASLFPIVENPKKNVPRALTYSILLVGFIYTLFVASILAATPQHLLCEPGKLLTDILYQLFPHNRWFIGAIHLAIISAIVGTIHSMIWGSSSLLSSLVSIVTEQRYQLKQSRAVLIIGTGILITFLSFKDLDLFFNLTASFIISAFILSFITLLTLKNEWKLGNNYKTVIAIMTSLLIFYFAFESIFMQLIAIYN